MKEEGEPPQTVTFEDSMKHYEALFLSTVYRCRVARHPFIPLWQDLASIARGGYYPDVCIACVIE